MGSGGKKGVRMIVFFFFFLKKKKKTGGGKPLGREDNERKESPKPTKFTQKINRKEKIFEEKKKEEE